jgi:hypothetical protein
MKKEEELPEDDFEDDEEMGDNDQDARINAIDLAIKAVQVSGSTKDPANIVKIAKDFYLFIIGEDEQ